MLFFIELGTRRVHFAGITTNPNQVWVTQQARQLVWKLREQDLSLRFLIHDNDTKFSQSFDVVFQSEGFHVIHTPYFAPNANAFAKGMMQIIESYDTFDSMRIRQLAKDRFASKVIMNQLNSIYEQVL